MSILDPEPDVSDEDFQEANPLRDIEATVLYAQASKNLLVFGSSYFVEDFAEVRESNREANTTEATQLAERKRLRQRIRQSARTCPRT